MAYVTNMDLGQRVYTDDKQQVTNGELMVDHSGMNAEVETNMENIIKAARASLKKRKPSYDFKTKNTSFLNLYNDLYKLGIKNNKFFLRIYDTDLLNIDPYQKMLPLDLQMKIILECIINPWYYLREICRIPADGTPIEIGGGVPFNIDRANLAAWYCFLNGIDNYLSKPRQTGKTQNDIAELNYAYHFGAISSSFLFFNKDLEQSKRNLYRFKCQRDMLPEYMQMKFIVDDNGKMDNGQDNITQMRNPVTNNIISVMPKASSKDSAVKLGRGCTSAFIYFDEFDFTPFIKEIVNASSFAYSTAHENATKHGSLSCRLISSTPGDLDTRDGNDATVMIRRMLKWNDTMLDLPINQLKKILASTGYNGIVFIEYTWKQLKKSVSWYEQQCKLVDYDEEQILREIELQRISGSNASPFKRSDMIYLSNNKKKPLKSIDYSKNLCPFNIYEELHKEYAYILSIDPSEGLSQDNNAVSLINTYTQAVAAEFKSPYISQPDLVKLCVQFMDEFCPKAMIVIENNKGRECINCFLQTRYRYNLWYDKDKLNQRIVESNDEYGALKTQANIRRSFGITTGSNRNAYYAILENYVNERKDILYTEYIVEDIIKLIRKPSGRIEAGPDAHDDNIMSYLFGLYVYYNATNLDEFNVVRGASAPSNITANDSPEAVKTKIKSLLNYLPDEMKSVFKEIVEEKDPVSEAKKYEEEIQQYQRNYNSAMGEKESEKDFQFLTPDQDEARQRSLDNAVFDSNFSQDTEVHIEDWI